MVAKSAINTNARLTINLWPDVPSRSQWITVKVGDYRKQLLQVISAFSPWVSELLGDGPGNAGPPALLSFPMPTPQPPCNLGFRLWRPISSRANGLSFRAFVQIHSPEDADRLKGVEAQWAQIIQEMFHNRDTVNPLLIKSPLDEDANGNLILNCHVEQDLGVSHAGNVGTGPSTSTPEIRTSGGSSAGSNQGLPPTIGTRPSGRVPIGHVGSTFWPCGKNTETNGEDATSSRGPLLLGSHGTCHHGGRKCEGLIV